MPIAPELRHELNRLRRRIVLTTFARSFAAAAVIVAALVGVAVVALHTYDRPLAPTPWWAVGLAPIAVWAMVHARRGAPPEAVLATHLDRRSGAEGILIAGLERDASAWRDRIERSLDRARLDAPRATFGRPLAQTAAAIAGVAALALLPAVVPAPGAATSRALERALDAATADLELATVAGLLDEADADALRQRADELQDRLLAGDPVAWHDVDALRERIERGTEAGASGVRALQASADALAQAFADGSADPRDIAELARLAELGAELGMLEDLPPEVRAALEQLAARGGVDRPESGAGSAGGALDPAGLDPARLRQLAEALKRQGGKRMQRTADAVGGAGPDAGALRRLLEDQGILAPGELPGGATGGDGLPVAQGGDGEFDPTPRDGAGGGPPGRGGVGRGRGDAALQHDNDTDVDTSGLRAEKLPEGAAVPDRWDVASVTRAEPDVAPVRADAPGSTAPVSGRGDVTFRRDLAPRHREAVRRFFQDRQGGGR